MFVVEQHRDVDVALAVRGAACPASVQPGETYRRVAAQRVRKTAAQASNVVVAGGHGHGISRSDTLSIPRRDGGKPRTSIARPARKGNRAVIRIGAGQSRRHANRTSGTWTVDDASRWSNESDHLGPHAQPYPFCVRPLPWAHPERRAAWSTSMAPSTSIQRWLLRPPSSAGSLAPLLFCGRDARHSRRDDALPGALSLRRTEHAGERERHPLRRQGRLAEPCNREPQSGRASSWSALGPSVPLLLPGRAPVVTWADSPLPRTDEDFSRTTFLHLPPRSVVRAHPGRRARRRTGGTWSRVRNLGNRGRGSACPRRRSANRRHGIAGLGHPFRSGLAPCRLFQQLSAGLMAPRRGLGIHWRYKAVVVVSEFGRTAAENGGHAWPLSTTSRGSRSPVSRGLTASRE